MSDIETSIEVNGKTIELGVDYLGNASAMWDEGNRDNSELVVAVDGVSETFEVWGSYVEPAFDTEDKVLDLFSHICAETLDVIFDQADELIPESMSLNEQRALMDSLESNADKIIEGLALSEDDLVKIESGEYER